MSLDEIAREARFQVLEITVAALVAQLPQPALEEVVGLLTYVAGVSEEAAQVTGSDAAARCAQVRQWAEAMLNRVITSRKSSRAAGGMDDNAANQRFPDRAGQF